MSFSSCTSFRYNKVLTTSFDICINKRIYLTNYYQRVKFLHNYCFPIANLNCLTSSTLTIGDSCQVNKVLFDSRRIVNEFKRISSTDDIRVNSNYGKLNFLRSNKKGSD